MPLICHLLQTNQTHQSYRLLRTSLSLLFYHSRQITEILRFCHWLRSPLIPLFYRWQQINWRPSISHLPKIRNYCSGTTQARLLNLPLKWIEVSKDSFLVALIGTFHMDLRQLVVEANWFQIHHNEFKDASSTPSSLDLILFRTSLRSLCCRKYCFTQVIFGHLSLSHSCQ